MKVREEKVKGSFRGQYFDQIKPFNVDYKQERTLFNILTIFSLFKCSSFFELLRNNSLIRSKLSKANVIKK